MNRAPQHFFLCICVTFGAWCVSAIAQPSVATAVQAGASSPVDNFRRLLAMPADARDKVLADKSRAVRERLLAKLNEYGALTPADREARLRATELQWYLLPLMNTPVTNRTSELSRIPPPLRPTIESRLQQWDRLPPSLQKLVKTNQQAVNLFTHVEVQPNSVQNRADEIRLKVSKRLNELVELNARKKQAMLHTLSDVERQQMEKTLRAFEQLPRDQRERCIRSFSAFTTMSADEQQEFIKNAARWSQMSPEDRQAWRELIQRVPILSRIRRLTISQRPNAMLETAPVVTN